MSLLLESYGFWARYYIDNFIDINNDPSRGPLTAKGKFDAFLATLLGVYLGLALPSMFVESRFGGNYISALVYILLWVMLLHIANTLMLLIVDEEGITVHIPNLIRNVTPFIGCGVWLAETLSFMNWVSIIIVTLSS